MSLALINQENDGAFSDAVRSLRSLNADDLTRMDQEIVMRMHSPVAMIPDLAGHLINAGGKRLRPMLTLSAARLFGYNGGHHILLAAAVELIHGATLLHDDVVDASRMRRGTKTANIIWGNKESVLVGDYIFSRAFELMVTAENLRVLKILSHASSVIAEGEVLQLATQKNLKTTQDMYIDVINAKTAALFAAATQAGAIVASAPQAEEIAMEAFGRNFGIAYQLVDDALDYAGLEGDLGKSVGDDFREGKMTLPVILSVAQANYEEKRFWMRTIADGHQNDDDFKTACEIMNRHGAVKKTFELASSYTDSALENLNVVPATPHTKALRDLVQTSLSRTS